MPHVKSADERITDFLAECLYDPLKYVMGAFPWQEEKSIQVVPLADRYRKRFPNAEYGPDEWQCEYLDEWGAEMRKRAFNGRDAVDPIRTSIVSGHGIGKSTMAAWITKFILDTRPHSIGTITANTSDQLRSKTWSEVGKWHNMSLTEHWFQYINSSNTMMLKHKAFPETWKCQAQTCDPKNSEAFAGQHTTTGTSFYLFDEASNIAEVFYEVREGGLIAGEPMVFDFGNGTRNTGRFYENCVGRFADMNRVYSIDSRRAHRTNKKAIQRDIERFGEDSDYVRVRWLGKFPNKASAQMIPGDEVEEAQHRMVREDNTPVVIGVDVARYGTDHTIIYPRRGNDARSFEYRKLFRQDTKVIAEAVVQYINELYNIGIRTSCVFVDGGGGYGGGVVDQLKSMDINVVEVMPTGAPDDKRGYTYKVDECWGRMRDAIPNMALPDKKELADQLTQREFGYTLKEKIRLESKDDMKARGISSPDIADALALTFAKPTALGNEMPQATYIKTKEYNPYEGEY